MRSPAIAFLAVLVSQPLVAQSTARQTDSDAYTRYELLAPGSGRFRITYEITATTPGAISYFNPIRKGSVASDESVVDRASGRPLAFDVVGAGEARAGGLRPSDSTQTYIRVHLARPVPVDGEARILILKTYQDSASYFTRGDTIVFTRPLGIKRNAVVLPKNYELVASSFPSQVLQEADGRISVSFWNATPSEAAVTLRAVPVKAIGAAASSVANYSLQQPESHAFDLYHDYTETRPGVSTYLNVVRAGSTVSSPRAVNLDTGEPIPHEVLRGDAIARAKLDVKDISPGTEVVVFRFPAVQPGTSVRLRMYETYTDTARYKLVGDELVWDRSFGRPSNTVVLPAGWLLTNSATPAVVTTRPDGRVQLEFINPRPDDVVALITARRKH
jgi:hypothetical protein